MGNADQPAPGPIRSMSPKRDQVTFGAGGYVYEDRLRITEADVWECKDRAQIEDLIAVRLDVIREAALDFFKPQGE